MNDFGLPVDIIIQDTQSSMHSLFALAPYLMKEPFCLATTDSVFLESEFSEFINYSLLREDIDGTLAVTRYIDDEKPLCVAMDEEDTILKFSDSKECYNWATGGIYYFSPIIFKEMSYALENGIFRLRNFLRLLVARGHILKGFSFSKIIDVDHVTDIPKAEELIKSEKK
jgi:NDP-sugar pyrophosphorylase family protein